MEEAGASQASVRAFHRSYDLLAGGDTGRIPEDEIEPVAELPKARTKADGEPVAPERAAELLSQACLLKLNGGLGTSMGLNGPKSLLPVKDGLTFLDLICRQVLRQRQRAPGLSFLLLNSYNTSAETRDFIADRYPGISGWDEIELIQNKVPKVDAATLAPAQAPADPELEWCPPGHGDLYAALAGSGRLETLLERGVRYLFASNSDNLGATLDLAILDAFATSGAPFLMEVTRRTAADRKGGHLCRDRKTGRLRLREVAQCPKGDLEAFQDVKKHRFFNTNNIWIDLHQLREALAAQGGSLPLPVIFNAKTVDPRDKESAKVVQLETAMGAAIEAFAGAAALVVPRFRFMPVKTTSDLLGLRSDAYTVTEKAELKLAGGAHAPHVDLDPDHYRLIDQLEAKTRDGVPSLGDCHHLHVHGPVAFAAGTVFHGNVTVTNASAEVKTLPAGTYTNQKIEL